MAVRPAGRSTASSAALSPADEEALASRVLEQISQEQGLDIPFNAATSIMRRGNKLYINGEWDDGELEEPRPNRMRALLGKLLSKR
jgi:hypothetical protein